MFDEFRGPLGELAIRQFFDDYGELIRNDAKFAEWELAVVVGFYNNLFLRGNKVQRAARFQQTVRAAYHALDSGFSCAPESLSRLAFQVIPRLPERLNLAMQAMSRADRRGSECFSDRASMILSAYKTLVERLAAYVFSPILLSLLAKKRKLDEFRAAPDGKVSLGKLVDLEKWGSEQSRIFTRALNVHLRNAYSHDRFKFVERERVRLWDENSKGKITWGPVTLDEEQLRNQAEVFFEDLLAVSLSLVIFSINRRDAARKNEWLPELEPFEYSDAERSQLVEFAASVTGFRLISQHFDEVKAKVVLRTKPKGIDQDAKIYVGGDGWSKGYRQRISFEEVPVIEQMLGFLQRIRDVLYPSRELEINVVSSEDGNSIGTVVANYKIVSSLNLNGRRNVDEDRKKLKIDTLGDAKLWFEKRGLPF